MAVKNAFRARLYTALLVALLWQPFVLAAAFDHTHGLYGGILKSYVQHGLVDYKALKENRRALDEYLNQVAAIKVSDFQTWSHNDQLAFLLNTYNAQTLQLIIDHYPAESIKKLNGSVSNPWRSPVVELFGKSVTLDDVEHEMIRKNFKEPRIHFVLVCGANGCPPLRSEPYQGNLLEKQLENQTKVFLSDPSKNRIDLDNQTLSLSPIFKWYKKDFMEESGSIQDFVQPYFLGGENTHGALSEFKIKYTKYDWSLNDSSR